MINKANLSGDLEQVRKQSPLVHSITNYVVMNNTANALLAIGASPVMAHAEDEVADMVSLASALVINIGTLSEKWVNAMLIAGKAALQKGIPVIFDPVGVGATPYRNETADQILAQCKPTVIRGNASEIMALVKEKINTKGVDSTTASNQAVASAQKLALETGAIVSVSGAEDYITDGHQVNIIKNGSPIMPRITGMGCTASAITGAFAAVNSNTLEAATHAMAVMGVTGELAAAQSKGPGSLQMHFIDQLYRLTDADFEILR